MLADGGCTREMPVGLRVVSVCRGTGLLQGVVITTRGPAQV